MSELLRGRGRRIAGAARVAFASCFVFASLADGWARAEEVERTPPKTYHATAVVRGIRSAADLEYERQLALTNRAMAPDLETVLLLSSPEHAHVSSTLVRQIARLGGDLSPFVPPSVARALAGRS